MRESDLTAKLIAALHAKLPGAVILKHNDATTSGIPDFSVSWNKRTIWVEVKLRDSGNSNPKTGIQFLTCKRLHQQSFGCYYVIYTKMPSRFVSVTTATTLSESQLTTDGFDHNWVADTLHAILSVDDQRA